MTGVKNYLLTIVYFLIMKSHSIFCTIDVNFAELEYLVAHLDPYECRRLVAALHYTSYELPKSFLVAERKVNKEIPCFRQLLHWNISGDEGKGKTHEEIEHRLRQLNRNDLADWLGKTVFKQLGNDLEKAIENPFGELGEGASETSYPITLEPVDEPDEEDPWLPVDTLLLALLVGLLAALLFLIGAIVVHKVRHAYIKRRNIQARGELIEMEEATNLINKLEEETVTESETDNKNSKRKVRFKFRKRESSIGSKSNRFL